MKTEQRRTDRIIKSSQEMELLLERILVGRLAVTTKEGPYIIAVNYLFFEGSIFIHSSRVGRKMKALQDDPRVCFLVDEAGPQVLWDEGCGISQIYKSVVCFGTIEFVEDAIEKRNILERMLQKYVPSNYTLPNILDQNIKKTAVIKIIIDSMTGKENVLSSMHEVLPGKFSEE